MKYIFPFFLFIISLVVNAQVNNNFFNDLKLPPYSRGDEKKFEFGGFLQLGNYQGDLNPSNFTLISTDPGIGIFIKKKPYSTKPQLYLHKK